MSKNPSYFNDDDEDDENHDENAVVSDTSDVEEEDEAVKVDDEDDPDKDNESIVEEEDNAPINFELGSDDEEDEVEDEHYLQKFDAEINKNYILDFHPECMTYNKTEINAMTRVRRVGNVIVDELHRTIPFLTKYERARIIGQRASQINSGSTPFIKNIPTNIIDGYLIAEMELEAKTIPFIIRRPLPNGGSEFWKVKDLEYIL
jgi:DNA-directed RNA polymerase I, II, and III subunit RPABC2